MDAASDKMTEFIQRELSKDKNQMIDRETQFISSGFVDLCAVIRSGT